jgi:hypothetical protein
MKKLIFSLWLLIFRKNIMQQEKSEEINFKRENEDQQMMLLCQRGL